MKKILLIFLLPMLAITSGHAQTATITKSLDSLFNYLEESKYFNGNVLVAANGQKIYSRSIGYREQGAPSKPLDEGSVFELASVSKQFTAAGILKLVSSNKLKLDQDIQTIFPKLPYKGITIRHLLNHTSGLPDYMELFDQHWDKKKIANNDDMLDLLAEYKPAVLFPPGEKWEYSNTGYALLASIIAKVSGESYAKYMKSEVFTPLGMNSSFIYSRRLAPVNIPDYAFGYVTDDEGMELLPDSVDELKMVYYLDGIQGDGTVNTTTGELLKWNNAIRDRKLLPAGLWDQALSPGKLNDGKKTGYGFGLMIKESPEVGKLITHNGGWPGYVTNMTNYLDKNVVVIILTNVEKDPQITQQVFNAVGHIATGRSYIVPAPAEEKKVADIDKSVYTRYTGTFSIKDFDLKVSTRDGKLFVQGTRQPEIEVLPESETSFFVKGQPIGIEFRPGADGSVKSLLLHQGGITEFKKQ